VPYRETFADRTHRELDHFWHSRSRPALLCLQVALHPDLLLLEIELGVALDLALPAQRRPLCIGNLLQPGKCVREALVLPRIAGFVPDEELSALGVGRRVAAERVSGCAQLQSALLIDRVTCARQVSEEGSKALGVTKR
jgi:hypothetical protein